MELENKNQSLILQSQRDTERYESNLAKEMQQRDEWMLKQKEELISKYEGKEEEMLKQLVSQISTLQVEIDTTAKQIREKEHEIKILSEHKSSVLEENKRLQDEVTALKNTIVTEKKERQAADEQTAEEMQKLQSLHKTQEEEWRGRYQEHRQQLQNAKSMIDSLKKKNSDLQENIESLGGSLEEIQIEVSEKDNIIKKLNKQVECQKKADEDVEKIVLKAQEGKKILENSLHQNEIHERELEEELEETKIALRNAQEHEKAKIEKFQRLTNAHLSKLEKQHQKELADHDAAFEKKISRLHYDKINLEETIKKLEEDFKKTASQAKDENAVEIVVLRKRLNEIESLSKFEIKEEKEKSSKLEQQIEEYIRDFKNKESDFHRKESDFSEKMHELQDKLKRAQFNAAIQAEEQNSTGILKENKRLMRQLEDERIEAELNAKLAKQMEETIVQLRSELADLNEANI